MLKFKTSFLLFIKNDERTKLTFLSYTIEKRTKFLERFSIE